VGRAKQFQPSNAWITNAQLHSAMKILTETLQHIRNLCTCTHLRPSMSCHVSNEKNGYVWSREKPFTSRWIKKPFKGRPVGFRIVECRTSTPTTRTSSEKKLSGQPWGIASSLLPIYFWTIGSGVASVFYFLIY